LLSISFSPLVPEYLLYALAGVAALLIALAVVSRGPVAILRAVAIALVLLALANPALVQEERDPVKDIVAVVVDRSTSQGLGDRPAMTERVRAELQRRLASMPEVEPRFIEGGDGEGDDGTRLFAALANGLADVPPDRLAGVLMITDGVVHDIPANAALLGFRAPLHALVTGRPDERDRQIKLIEAPRFGIVGRDQTIRAEVAERGGTGSATVTVRRDGQQILRRDVRTGQPFSLTVRVEHGGPNVVEIEADGLPNELTNANNRAVVTIEGIREKLACCSSPANLTPAKGLGEPPEVGRERRPRPLHDPAPAGEAGRDADQRAVADRLPHPRAVPAEDQGVRSHHLRPLREPERAAATYFENIVRYVREGGAVLVAAGPEFSTPASLARTRLQPIIPGQPDGRVLEEPYKARVTEGGERHP
jgi:hypothetical protein